MAKINQSTAKGTMSLNGFGIGSEGSSTTDPLAAPEEVVAQKEVWDEDDMRKSECGRVGHIEGVLEWWERAPSGELVWSTKEYKGECALCGARKVS